MKMYSVWHDGCGKTRMFETFDKKEAEQWIKDNAPKEYADRFYICEQGKDDMTQTIREVMAAYDERRKVWLQEFGTDKGFNEWFSGQVGFQAVTK